MENDKAENCWEYWNCSPETRKEYPAFLYDSGKECWMVAGHCSETGGQCPRIKHRFKNCFDCPWFQKQNSNLKEGQAVKL